MSSGSVPYTSIVNPAVLRRHPSGDTAGPSIKFMELKSSRGLLQRNTTVQTIDQIESQQQRESRNAVKSNVIS